MITIVAIALINLVTLLLLAGLVALHSAHKNAVDGYEDQSGFHRGVEPRPSFQSDAVDEIHTGSGRAA